LKRRDDPALLSNIEGQARAVRHLRSVARHGDRPVASERNRAGTDDARERSYRMKEGE
jgi:hypothetical protein